MTVNVIVKTYGSEVNWHIDNQAVHGPYPDQMQDTQVITLEPGEHTLNYIDTYGDGWHGGTIEIEGFVAPIAVHGSGAVTTFTV